MCVSVWVPACLLAYLLLQIAFPQFAYEFYSKRLGLRSLVDQACRELLYNVQVSRKEFLEVEIFARFLEVRGGARW